MKTKCSQSGLPLNVNDPAVSCLKEEASGRVDCPRCGKSIRTRLVGFGHDYYGPKSWTVPRHNKP